MGQFSNALRAAMGDLGWNQLELAKKTGAVSQTTISDYLSGKALPKVTTFNEMIREMPSRIQEDLATAYLTDQTPEAASHLVQVVSIQESPSGKSVKYVYGRAPDGSILRRDLDILERRALDDPNLAKALNFLAASLEGASPSPEYYDDVNSSASSVMEEPLVVAAQKKLEEEERAERRAKSHRSKKG